MKAKIGSRPAKRGNKKVLEFEDLRAISFVGSWSQLKQNVPGYFGVGTALKKLADAGKTNELKKLFNEVPFFKVLMLNSMMSLSKCYFELTAYFKKDKEFKDFWNILYKEYKLSKEMLLKISGFKDSDGRRTCFGKFNRDPGTNCTSASGDSAICYAENRAKIETKKCL